MAYPPRVWVYLLEFYLVRSYWCSQAIEDQEACTRCTLVYCTYEGFLEYILVPLRILCFACNSFDFTRLRNCHCYRTVPALAKSDVSELVAQIFGSTMEVTLGGEGFL